MDNNDYTNKCIVLANALNEFILHYDYYRFDEVFANGESLTNAIYSMLFKGKTSSIEKYLSEMIDDSFFDFDLAEKLLMEVQQLHL